MSDLQIHRELTQKLGYKLELGGINLVTPGYRYVGVTYPEAMSELLKWTVGNLEWQNVLNAPDNLEPIAVFQFLPMYMQNGWFLTFKYVSGIYGVNWALGNMDLKYMLRDARSAPNYGWVFKSALMYSKRSNYTFPANPLNGINVNINPSMWGFDAVRTGKPEIEKTWGEYIADNQEYGVLDTEYVARVQRAYNEAEQWPTQTSYAYEIDKRSAMGIAIEAAREKAKLEAMQELNDQRMAILNSQIRPTTIAAGWEPVRYYNGNVGSWTKPSTQLPMSPVAPPAPPIKAKYGRMIKLVEDEE